MARIAGVDLPRDKRVEIGLTYIYGIGKTSAIPDLHFEKDPFEFSGQQADGAHR